MITQVILWILPPILFFLLVRFMRTNVESPKIIKAWYLMTIIMFIPIVGAILTVIILITFFVLLLSSEIKLKKSTKFYKKWMKS